MQSIRTLLAGIIDYAGLFPPAELPMASAAGSYASYRSGPHAWMLGRFVVPAARLEEFANAAEPFLKDQTPWKVTAICSPPIPEDLARIEAFRRRAIPAEVDTIEIKAARADEIRTTAHSVPQEFTTYVEIPLASEPSAFIRAISEIGARAKMRTGGVTPESIPDSSSVARFVLACAATDVPFKATAGLHHPLRGLHRLIPRDSSRRAMMHGFLNVFLGSAFARSGLRLEELIELLEEASLNAFTFEQECVRWRGHQVSKNLLLRVRQTFAIAFGSCSFEEPVEDLKAISLL